MQLPRTKTADTVAWIRRLTIGAMLIAVIPAVALFSNVLLFLFASPTSTEALGLHGEATAAEGSASTTEPGSESETLGQVSDRPTDGRLRIEVHKAERQLHFYRGREKLATYPVGLGFAPEGHKRREGDGTTPEGHYFVCVKNPQSQYYLSLGINYPNAEDGRRGLERGAISASEAAAIARAEERGICPPWNTELGGEIFIHGRGSSADWTLGCVALDDPAMKTLFEAVPVGTEVSILP